MKRRLLLGSMAFAALPSMASTLQPKALLTVSGRIGRVNNETTDTYPKFVKLPPNSGGIDQKTYVSH